MVKKSVLTILSFIIFQSVCAEKASTKKENVLAKQEAFQNSTIKNVSDYVETAYKNSKTSSYIIKDNDYYVTFSVRKIKKDITVFGLLKNLLTKTYILPCILPSAVDKKEIEHQKAKIKKKLGNLWERVKNIKINNETYITKIKTGFSAYKWPDKEKDIKAKNYEGIGAHDYPGIYKAKTLLYKYWLKHDKTITDSYRKIIEKELPRFKILRTKPLKIRSKAHKKLFDMIIKTG